MFQRETVAINFSNSFLIFPSFLMEQKISVCCHEN